jgi:hypothetical protein
MTPEPAPHVSVIVPARNAANELRRLSAALHEQTAARDTFEVLIVDDASTDGTADAVRTQPLARLIEVPATIGPYPARNLAVQAARGELLAFTDADCIPAPDWIERGIARFDNHDVDMIAGGIRIPLDDRPSVVSLVDAALHLDQELYATRGYGATANMWVRRSVFDEVGGFNRQILSGGDWEFGHRSAALGKRLVYAEEARVDHPPRERARELARKGYRLGIGSAQLRLHANGPLREGRAVWANPGAYLPALHVVGKHRLEASGHAPGRLKVAQILLTQYLFLRLPTIAGSFVGSLRERSGLRPRRGVRTEDVKTERER